VQPLLQNSTGLPATLNELTHVFMANFNQTVDGYA
jgi:hypothetical protein